MPATGKVQHSIWLVPADAALMQTEEGELHRKASDTYTELEVSYEYLLAMKR